MIFAKTQTRSASKINASPVRLRATPALRILPARPIPASPLANMRRRPSARLLILNSEGRLLLFRFVFKEGALAGQDYWATPGGALDPGESFEAAGIRELREETGIQIERVDPHIAEREFVMQMPDGEHVIAEERLYLIEIADLPCPALNCCRRRRRSGRTTCRRYSVLLLGDRFFSGCICPNAQESTPSPLAGEGCVALARRSRA
jgi:8-oxo-dGTP pyrophosphatase MutT (NUDIX family)